MIPPSGQSAHSQLFIGDWVCAPWRLLTGALVDRVTLASPLTQSTWTLGGLTFMLLQWGVGMADSHQDEEQKERPKQFHQELDLGETQQEGWWGTV